MDLKTLGKSIATVAPALGASIGGPVGFVAGMGVKALASFFGLADENTNPEENTGIIEKLAGCVNNMTYEQAAELKRIDAEFKVKMEELGIKVFELEVEDRKSARDMAKTVGIKIQATIAIIVGVAYYVMAGFILWRAFSAQQPVTLGDTLAILVGTIIRDLASRVEQAFAFFFGTTKGSSEKTNLLYQSTPQKQ